MQELSVLPLLRAGFNRVSRGLNVNMKDMNAVLYHTMLGVPALVISSWWL